MLLGGSQGTTIAEKSRCEDGVTKDDCEVLYGRSGDSWLGGHMWRDAWLEREIVTREEIKR